MSSSELGQPSGHALDTLLAGYACGLLSAPLHALIAAHLAISPENRRFVADLEAANGGALNAIEPVPIRDRDARLAAVFAAPMAPGAANVGDGVIPPPLARYLGVSLAEVRWRWILPGVKEFRKADKAKADSADGAAVLYWIRAGRRMPAHTHQGLEATLVLKGAFRDINGHYRRGDVAVADSDVDHQPVADRQEDCICFAVTDAPLRLTGPIGRILQRFIG